MFDIVAADDEKLLPRSHHQGLDNGETFFGRCARDAGHAEAAGKKARASDHGQDEKQRAEVAEDIDIFHGRD